MVVIHVSMTHWTKWRSYRNFRRSWFTIFYWWILSLRGRRLKGKGKGALWKGVLGAREREGRARKEEGLAWSRALIPFPFPFERLPRRLVNSACAAGERYFSAAWNLSKHGSAQLWLKKRFSNFTALDSSHKERIGKFADVWGILVGYLLQLPQSSKCACSAKRSWFGSEYTQLENTPAPSRCNWFPLRCTYTWISN